MDLAALRRASSRKRAVQKAAWQEATEALESRIFLSSNPASSVANLGTIPAIFAENQGQFADPHVRYIFQNGIGNILMTDNGPVFQLLDPATSTAETFFVSFDGANQVRPVGLDKSQAVFNYFTGGTPYTNVAGYQKILYKGLYNGVDLYTWGKADDLKYEFHVAPGVDYTQVKINYQGTEGLSIDSQGRLHIHAATGEIIDDAPFVYQMINGKQVAVKSSFKLLDSHTYTFQLDGKYDHTKELVLDPQLDFSTYVSGVQNDSVSAVATDQFNQVYVVGNTNFSAVATEFFFKEVTINNGTTLVSIPVIRDVTASGTSLPDHVNNTQDVFVAKFSPGGNPLWFTYYGGSKDENGNDIAVDSTGAPYIVGNTQSSDLAGTTLSLDPILNLSTFDTQSGVVSNEYGTNGTNGGTDAFLAKLDTNGNLVYSTYFGGTSSDTANSIAIDSNNIIYVAGVTNSQNDIVNPNPSPQFLQTFMNQSGLAKQMGTDGFLYKIDLTKLGASQIIWNTYVGGTGADNINGVAVDSSGNIYIDGDTASTDFTTNYPATLQSGGFQNQITKGSGMGTDGFVAKLNSDGASQWSTYDGGNGTDTTGNIAVDPITGRVAITGQTAATDFLLTGLTLGVPSLPNGNARSGTTDAFVTIYDNNGNPVFNTYLGGTGATDVGVAVNYDQSGNLFVGGNTNSTNFPLKDTTNPLIRIQAGSEGGTDGFIFEMDSSLNNAFTTFYGGSGTDNINDLTTDSVGALLVVGSTSSSDFLTLHQANAGQIRLTPPAQITLNTTRGTGGNTDGFVSRIIFSHAQGVPIKPVTLTANPISDSRIDLSWHDQADNETSFNIRRSTSINGTYVSVGNVGANVTAFSDTGLDPATPYYYVVNAINSVGSSDPTNKATATTKTGAIVAPTGLTATAISSSRIDLAWNDNSDNEGNFLIYRTVTSVGIFELVATVGPNTTTFSDTGLDPATQYSYHVQGVNSTHSSSFSNNASATTFGAGALTAPTNLTISVVASTSFLLNWTDKSDNETGFSVERANFADGIFSPLATTGANVNTYLDTSALAGTVYLYRVRAVNGATFSAYSNVVASNLGAAMPAPTLLEALATSNSSITLTWRDNATIETGYFIERAVGAPSNFSVIAHLSANAARFVDSGLLQRTHYYYRVRASDGTNFSAYSAVASDTTLQAGQIPPNAPSVIRLAALSSSSIRVTWRDNSATETAFSIERATALDGPYATINTVGPNVTTYTDTHLAAGVVYYYRVRARDGTLRSATSAIAKIRTLVLPRVTIHAIDATSNESGNPLVFLFGRKDNLVGNLVIRYSISGTAANGTDYNKLNGTVTILNGQSTVQLVVTPKSDNVTEGTETVKLTIAPNAAYRISPSLSNATGTITNTTPAVAAAVKKQSFSLFSQDLLTGLV